MYAAVAAGVYCSPDEIECGVRSRQPRSSGDAASSQRLSEDVTYSYGGDYLLQGHILCLFIAFASQMMSAHVR